MTGRRVWLRRVGAIAAAAAAAAIVVWTTVGVTPPVPLATVAQVERVQGVVGMRIGDVLGADATIATGNGQLALRLASGGSLRLGPQTRLRFKGVDAADLSAGVVYFDSEGARGPQPFAITTELGTVRDVGTQFVVRVDAAQLEVGVRDGRVALEAGTVRDEAAAGDRLIVAAAGDIRRDSIAAVGDDWAWAEQLAPPFDINERRLGDFLAWFEQQTGREVVFADADTERSARETLLKGSIDLPPLPKLAAVETLTDFTFTVDSARVVVARR